MTHLTPPARPDPRPTPPPPPASLERPAPDEPQTAHLERVPEGLFFPEEHNCERSIF